MQILFARAEAALRTRAGYRSNALERGTVSGTMRSNEEPFPVREKLLFRRG